MTKYSGGRVERQPVPTVSITPTPEFVEAFGRAEAKHGFRCAVDHVREELHSIMNGDSVCVGLADEQAKHRAVAARYPHLYAEART
jgi:hypothetical protein